MGRIRTTILTCRGEILRVLYFADSPLGVRAIARGASVGLRSAQVALAALVNERCVVVRPAGPYPLYTINRSHEEFPIWKSIFDAITQALIEQRRDTVQQRASSILPFLEDSRQMNNSAKASRFAS